MLKLELWEDEDKKEDGYQYHCCGVDDSECDGTLNTWYREANYKIAKEKMLENLKRLRDDIDNLIKAEQKCENMRYREALRKLFEVMDGIPDIREVKFNRENDSFDVISDTGVHVCFGNEFRDI